MYEKQVYRCKDQSATIAGEDNQQSTAKNPMAQPSPNAQASSSKKVEVPDKQEHERGKQDVPKSDLQADEPHFSHVAGNQQRMKMKSM